MLFPPLHPIFGAQLALDMFQLGKSTISHISVQSYEICSTKSLDEVHTFIFFLKSSLKFLHIQDSNYFVSLLDKHQITHCVTQSLLELLFQLTRK
jgi:hypothetical protein